MARLEMVIWRVPAPVPGSRHLYRYRLFYGRPGKRIVGYDNERLTIRVHRDADAALGQMGRRFSKAWTTGKTTGDVLQFQSPAALFRALTPKG